MKNCVFCKKSPPEIKISNEHVMRAALAKYLPAQKKEFTWHNRFRENGLGEIKSKVFKVPKSPFEWVVNDVCKTCNEGWLESQVETPAEVGLKHAMQGQCFSFSGNLDSAIALWAAKTAAVRALIDPLPRSIPEEHYTYIKQNLSPPPNTFVWFASTEYIDKYFMRHTRFGTKDESGPLTSSHFTSIVYGHMALFVIGSSHADGLFIFNETIRKLEAFGAARIWPKNIYAKWPIRKLPEEVTKSLTQFINPVDIEFDGNIIWENWS